MLQGLVPPRRGAGAAPTFWGRCSPRARPHLPLPLPSSTLGVHKHQERMRPGPRADLEAESTDANAWVLQGWAQQPGTGPYLQTLPIHRGGVELEGLVVLGAGAGRGVTLRSPAVGLPVLWGTEVWMHPLPRAGGTGSRAGRLAAVTPCLALAARPQERDTYQDNGTDVGRQQYVVPQRAPIALRLHVGGTFVVELERAGGQDVRQGTPGYLSAPLPQGWPRGAHPGPPMPGYSR